MKRRHMAMLGGALAFGGGAELSGCKPKPDGAATEMKVESKAPSYLEIQHQVVQGVQRQIEFYGKYTQGDKQYESVDDYLEDNPNMSAAELAYQAAHDNEDEISVLTTENEKYDKWIDEALAATNMGYLRDFFIAKGIAESGLREDAVSPAGARGLYQLMEGTGQEYGAKHGLDPNTPEGNIKIAAHYYKYLLDMYQGDQWLALAAYNCGYAALDQRLASVDRSKLTPRELIKIVPPGETQLHLIKVGLLTDYIDLNTVVDLVNGNEAQAQQLISHYAINQASEYTKQ